MYINIIRSSVRDVVAICDDDLLGKKFEEGKAQLNVQENFYAGEKKSREEVLELIDFYKKEDATFNVVGEDSVALMKEMGIISDESVGSIDSIPFCLVLM